MWLCVSSGRSFCDSPSFSLSLSGLLGNVFPHVSVARSVRNHPHLSAAIYRTGQQHIPHVTLADSRVRNGIQYIFWQKLCPSEKQLYLGLGSFHEKLQPGQKKEQLKWDCRDLVAWSLVRWSINWHFLINFVTNWIGSTYNGCCKWALAEFHSASYSYYSCCLRRTCQSAFCAPHLLL